MPPKPRFPSGNKLQKIEMDGEGYDVRWINWGLSKYMGGLNQVMKA